MTDYLLVHGAGQGAWSWGQVWGYLTAPVEHPPRLDVPHPVNQAYSIDLPGHGSDLDGDTAEVRLEECVHTITRTVEREQLRDVVMVGHDFSGALVLQAAGELPRPPKRLVLLAGIVPARGRSMVSVFPHHTRAGYRTLALLSKLSHQDFKLPRPVINYLCHGMDPMEVVPTVGHFGPLPTRVLTSRVALDHAQPPCPVTYIVLLQDKILPPDIQRRMAARIPGAEIIEMDASHQVMLYKPRELADILLRYA